MTNAFALLCFAMVSVAAQTTLDDIRRRKSFLMVGTLEPCKGHEQVLEAFEQLWRFGQDVYLVIVGKQDWLVEKIVARLRAHPELNKRLFWFEGINDEYQDKIYRSRIYHPDISWEQKS